MRRLIMVVTALVVGSFLAAPVVAAAALPGASLAPAYAAVGPRGHRGEGRPEGRPDKGRRGGPGAFIERMLMMAVLAPWAKEDAQVQRLVDKTVVDRKAMIRAEGASTQAFETFLAGVRAGKTKEELQPELDAMKAAQEALKEKGKTLHEDLKAIRERMKELRPERAQGDRRGKGGEGAGKWRDRRNRKSTGGDFPPKID